jgi:hypothetical protein
MSKSGAATTPAAGARDFDFLRGSWSVLSRKLENPLDPLSEDWREFTMDVTNEPILGGLGNIDRYRSTEFPGQPEFEAFALRLFDGAHGVWRIWWVSTSSGGELDTPVVGRFLDTHGVFECDDVLAGRSVRVRYEWRLASGSPRWRQSFSFDAGRTWRENWLMDWRRVD